MKISGIYKIQSKIKPERIYIGSSIDIIRRKYLHFWDLKRGSHISIKLQRHYNKYGEADLSFALLLGCAGNDLLKNEQFFIDAFNPYFNCCPIAGNSLGIKRTDEFKLKISIANTGKKRSEETKKKMSESRKGLNTWAVGNKNCLGRIVSEETKNKMRQSHLGQKSWNKGTVCPEEVKLKISKTKKENFLRLKKQTG
jgi:group I intron endonuclease